MDSQCQHKISENQKSIVLKLFVTNPSTNVIGDSKISDSIARKPVNFSSTVPCTSPCTHTRMFTWLAPVRTHARSPGDGDGPRRDELLLGAAVLAVCRCLRRSPGCERRSSWAPWPCRLEKCPRERTAASCRRLIWMPGSAGLAAAFAALVLCPGRRVRRRRPPSFAGLTELCCLTVGLPLEMSIKKWKLRYAHWLDEACWFESMNTLHDVRLYSRIPSCVVLEISVQLCMYDSHCLGLSCITI